MGSKIVNTRECCVYWIRLPEHTDIFTQGYVGITCNYDFRIYCHIKNSNNPKQHHNYRTDFREALSGGSFIHSKIIIGTREYCLEVEGKLRPDWKIGWNIAKGGSGGIGKHGLTGKASTKIYYNMLTRARKDYETVFDEWLGEDGLVNFTEFYELLPEDGELTIKTTGLGYNPENLIKMSRSDICRRAGAVHDLGDGKLYSISELSEMYGIKANTISTNLSRGFTIRQSLGLDEKDRGVEFSYEKEMAIHMLWNTSMTHHQIGKEVGLDKSTLRRQLDSYNIPSWLFTHCELISSRGISARRIRRSRIFSDFSDILDIEDRYIEGESIYSISKSLDVSHNAIKDLLEELENADYY